MPYGDITVNSKTFQPRDPGVYSLSTLTFGNPRNEFRIRGGTKGKDGSFRGSITRLYEKEVTVNGTITVPQAIVTVSITAPTAFTASELDVMTSDIDVFLTSAIITRLLAGES